MSKCNIFCGQHNETRRDWEVTADGRVWPCCYYANAWDMRRTSDNGEFELTATLINDNKFFQLLQTDPDFNNLAMHSFDKIISHPIYTSYIYFEGWNSEEPPTTCVKECEVIIHDLTGKPTTHAEEGGAWSSDSLSDK